VRSLYQRLNMGKKRPTLTGFAWGVCFALLISSLLLVWQGLAVVYAFGLIFLPGLVVGVWLGMLCTHHGYIPALPVWGVLLIVVLGWPLCAYGPIAARVAWMERQVRSQVPVMPQAENVSVDVNWLGSDSYTSGRSCIEFDTNASQQSVFAFYRQRFSARGWSEDLTRVAEYAQANGLQANDLPRLFFQKSGYGLGIDFTVKKTAQNRTAAPLNEVCYEPD
jgi:hypothetical protein